MRRFTLALCLFPFAGTAETFVVNGNISDVTLYPNSAKITKTAAFSIPAGTHNIVMRNIAIDPELFPTIRANVTGAQAGAINYRKSADLDGDQTGREDIRDAEDAIVEIKQQIAAVENDARQARLAAVAAQTRIGFLDQLGSNEGTPLLDSDSVRALSQMIGAEALDARQIALTAEISAQNIELALPNLNDKLKDAQKNLDLLQENDVKGTAISIEVASETATDGVLSLTYNTFSSSSWTPIYDIYLDRENSDYIDIQRGAFVIQKSGENWTDVNLTLSTLEPDKQIAPSFLSPQRRRLVDPRPENYLAEPLVEAPVILEESGSSFGVQSSGLGTVYKITRPVSIKSGAEVARIPLGNLRIPAKLSARAVPSRDDTAFLMAKVTNDTQEEILETEFASFYVDGAFAGTQYLKPMTPKDTIEVSFGPINGLRLKSTRMIGGEGESGIISRYNETRSHWRYEVENLTDKTWNVQMLGAVPFSDHDDLTIEWTASLQPDNVDVDDRIGLLGWDLTLAPDAVQSVDLETQLKWPSDKELR